MYRFNGVDGRLERSMEAVCMVMEALESYEHKFKVRFDNQSSALFQDPFQAHSKVDGSLVF